ncbi:MAG: hypothetical protein R3B06_29635 [Kofleriaceae bacterium]
MDMVSDLLARHPQMKALAAAVVASLLVACVQPIVRPMRTIAGPRITLAGGAAIGAADEVSCYEGCTPDQVEGVVVAADGGYGWMLAPWLGASAGARIGAGKVKAVRGLGVAWGQLTFQNPTVALAVGTEVGANVIGPVVGVDLRPWPAAGERLTVSAYVHYAQPFTELADPGDDAALERASFDGGVTVRADRWLVQYSYYAQRDGRFEVKHLEGASRASAWHALVIGRDLLAR